jgi:hypothetical protein
MQQLARRLLDAWAWASKLACQKSEKRVHLARLHAACMAARPFRLLVWAKVGVACNRRAVVCTARGGLASSASEPVCMTCGTQPPRRRGGPWSVLEKTRPVAFGGARRESRL